MIKKYRKKPVIIEAIQWTGENPIEIFDFINNQNVDICNNQPFTLFTLEGQMTVSVGDYVIKGVKGEFYLCKPDIFKQTYEVDE